MSTQIIYNYYLYFIVCDFIILPLFSSSIRLAQWLISIKSTCSMADTNKDVDTIATVIQPLASELLQPIATDYC